MTDYTITTECVDPGGARFGVGPAWRWRAWQPQSPSGFDSYGNVANSLYTYTTREEAEQAARDLFGSRAGISIDHGDGTTTTIRPRGDHREGVQP